MGDHRVLVATTNEGKLREIRFLLANAPITLLTLKDLPPIDPPEETGLTFSENARLKARYYAKASALRTVAEDSGLVVDALSGRPGVESARYGGGVDVGYPDKFARLYAELSQVDGADSRARFVCAVAMIDGDRIEFETQGVVEGRIAPAPAGSGGFGYDPIFFYPPYGCTLAEAGDRKAAVSHRGEAFRKLAEYLAGFRRT